MQKWKMALAAGCLGVSVAGTASAEFRLKLEGSRVVGIGEAEILSFSNDGNVLASTTDTGVRLFTVNDPSSILDLGTADFSTAFNGTGAALSQSSSTDLDPLGRGFGVASLLPDAVGGTDSLVGKVGIYNYSTGTVLGTIDVGFHPDSVRFSNDGSTLYVANEAEYDTNGVDSGAKGSLSIIDFSTVTGVGDVVANASFVSTTDFSAGNLAGAAVGNIAGVRSNTAGDPIENTIEPEFITFNGDKVLLSIQEGNAIGEFDTTSGQWTNIFNLGTITNTIDPSDEDGPGGIEAALIDDAVKGLPMPDAIATFTKNGTTYLLTANEGDARPDDIDAARVKSFDGLDGIVADTSDAGLGRLTVSIPDSDTDGDDLLEDIVAFGTRSVSIWNADTGSLVADTGSFEPILLAEDPTRHNANDGGDPGEFDKRSDNKGPEPEGLDVIVTEDGTVLMAVGMERQNGIMLWDLTDPTNPQFLDYINNRDEGMFAPESLVFVPGSQSPNGEILLIVGYEGDADEGIAGGIAIYTIPEPASIALIGLGGLMLLRRQRPAA